MLFTGDLINGETAQKWGLALSAVSDDQLDQEGSLSLSSLSFLFLFFSSFSSISLFSLFSLFSLSPLSSFLVVEKLAKRISSVPKSQLFMQKKMINQVLFLPLSLSPFSFLFLFNFRGLSVLLAFSFLSFCSFSSLLFFSLLMKEKRL